MLKKTTLCFASILLAALFAGTAQADPLTITGGHFAGTTQGIDRPWSFNFRVGANFQLIATGERFSPSAGFNLQPGDSLTIKGATGSSEGTRATLTIDGVTYTNLNVDPNLQFSPTVLIIPDLAPGETATFNVPFSMTGSVLLSNTTETSPRYMGQTFFEFVGSGIGTFSLTRGSTGIFISGVSYVFNDPTAVPEPATLVLLSTGLAGAIGAARKRRSVKKQS